MKHRLAFILAILLLVPALPVYGTTKPANDKASHTTGFTDVPAA